jgi:hypothetical protein
MADFMNRSCLSAEQQMGRVLTLKRFVDVHGIIVHP